MEIILIIFVGVGLAIFLNRREKEAQERDMAAFSSFDNFETNQPVNKIVNVSFTGGIIGLFTDSPKRKLQKVAQMANEKGLKIVEVIPASGGNLFTIFLRLFILVVTMFLYTPASGYYVILENANQG